MMKKAEANAPEMTPFWRPGQAYLLRTVTHYYTGRLVERLPDAVVLDEAAWIADTGRFGKALAEGTLEEVEPYPGRVLVSLGALVDACEWAHPLPRKAK